MCSSDLIPNALTSVGFAWTKAVTGLIGCILCVEPAVLGQGTQPSAQGDFYTKAEGGTLMVAAPGVLGNDTASTGGGSLSAALVSGPAHGTLNLTNNGGFTYTPVTNFTGADGFSYQANDGSATSSVATVTIMVTPAGALYFDDFTRPADPGSLLPWTNRLGNWTVTGGELRGSSSSAYALAYTGSNWIDYSVEGRIQFSAPNAEGGGLGGRLNPTTGAQYAAWVYPEGSSQGPSLVMQLVKYRDWTSFPFTVMQQVTLTNSMGTNWHAVKLRFQGNQILSYFDGNQVMSLTDDGSFDGQGAYTNGGISAVIYTGSTAFTMAVDQIIVMPLQANNAPVLSAPSFQGNQFSVSVSTLSGAVYDLEYKANLRDADWTPVASVPGDGFVHVLADSAATGPQRFYRVRVE